MPTQPTSPAREAIRGTVPKLAEISDQIIYGEAVDSETQASQSHGRRGAAGDARRLYYRVYDYFPQSPLAGEALDERPRDHLFECARSALQLDPVIPLQQREHFLTRGVEQLRDLVNPNRCQIRCPC